MTKRNYILLVVFLFGHSIFGQKINLEIHSDEIPLELNWIEKANNASGDSVLLELVLVKLINRLHAEGYLLASIDSTRYDINIMKVKLSIGKRFEWVNLDQGNLPENILNKVGYAEKNYNRKFVKSDKLKKLFQSIIEYSENHGHPFASIRLDSIKLSGASLSGSLHYKAGPLIRFGSLKIIGSNSVKKSFLEKYLGVQPGFIYAEKKLKSIPGKLNSLIFITLKNQVYQTFQNDESSIYLEIEDRPVNKVDGVIGILPNEGSNKKILVTGQLDLSLNNLFNSGKRLNIDWQRVRKESQFLNMDYLHPNLLNTNLNFNTSLNLLKEDTSFFNITAKFGLSYLFGSGFEFQLFSKIKSGRLGSTKQFSAQNALPPFSDFDINSFGVRVDFRKLDHPVSPRKGLTYFIDFSVGSKKIKPNTDLDPALYSSIDLNDQQFEVKGGFATYQPLHNKWHLAIETEIAKLFNDNLFLNDLFRLGGLNTLRGFNQNFFFASEYLLLKLEPRYYFSRDSFVFVFYDQAFISQKISNMKSNDQPLGFGAGISLNVNNGVVNLAYAIGHSKNQPIDPNLSKFHFGYVAKF